MIRAFVAIPLPEENQAQLKNAVRSLRELNLDARFPAPESIHLTLKFLGDIDESQVGPVAAVLDRCCRSRVDFSVRLEGLGAFPHSANPRILWMGVDAGPELGELQHAIETGLVDLGFGAEEKPFRPHLTVARIKGKRNFKELVRLLRSDEEAFQAGSFQVNSIFFYRSELKPAGAEYSVLHQASLAKENPSDE